MRGIRKTLPFTSRGDQAQYCEYCSVWPDFCVGCLSLVSEERDAGAIDPEALDAKLKQTKRDISREKVRASSMSIASGCDYGVQSRITELEWP